MSFEQAARLGVAADIMGRMADDAEAVVGNLRRQLAAERAKVRELQIALGRAQQEKAGLAMGGAGLLAQAKALKSELKRVCPSSKLLALTGKIYKSGAAQDYIGLVYDQGFDAKCIDLKLPYKGSACRDATA